MTKVATAVVTTVAQEFPAGTTEGQFLFELTKADGTSIDSKSVDGTSVTFEGLDVGDYNVRVSKNGVSADAKFSVTADTVSLQVPASVSVSLA